MKEPPKYAEHKEVNCEEERREFVWNERMKEYGEDIPYLLEEVREYREACEERRIVYKKELNEYINEVLSGNK